MAVKPRPVTTTKYSGSEHVMLVRGMPSSGTARFARAIGAEIRGIPDILHREIPGKLLTPTNISIAPSETNPVPKTGRPGAWLISPRGGWI
ncbi:hypothetical protein VTJ04DRAFT_2016 [Mycothermus thermophilus]|uniref:uncharacterized protein n=1 Tax=Humicola insolens TaxID=85995 RepID=UPI003742D7DC